MNDSINKRLRKYREEAGYTQKEIADLIGATSNAYTKMERDGKIYTSYLPKLSLYLKVDVMTLLYGDNIPELQLDMLNERRQNLKANTENKEKFYLIGVNGKEREYIKKFRILSESRKNTITKITDEIIAKMKF